MLQVHLCEWIVENFRNLLVEWRWNRKISGTQNVFKHWLPTQMNLWKDSLSKQETVQTKVMKYKSSVSVHVWHVV